MLPTIRFAATARRTTQLLLGLACAAGAVAAHAQATQAAPPTDPALPQTTLRWIDSAVATVAASNTIPLRMEVSVGALDSRLRLAPCNQVEPFLPTGTRLWGKSRIGLRCVDGSVRWSVFLPVTVKAFGQAWVAKGVVAAGTVLGADDAMLAEVDWAEESSPVMANAEQWLGQIAARSWSPGQPIRHSMVKPAQVFQAGTQIRVLAEGPGFQVASDGLAMSAGVIGQPAKVRMDNGRVMSGVVLDSRTIKLEM